MAAVLSVGVTPGLGKVVSFFRGINPLLTHYFLSRASTWRNYAWTCRLLLNMDANDSWHFVVVQSLGRVWLSVTPWIAARQASLSITTSQSLLNLMSIELVMPSNRLILCLPLLLLPSIFPSIRLFSRLFTLGGKDRKLQTSCDAAALWDVSPFSL